MSLITSSRGDILLAYHAGTTLDIPETEQSTPMPFVIVHATYQGKSLFVFNRKRNHWELPGGLIDEGEAPHESAIRELGEESGQTVHSVDYASWMKFQLAPDNRIELGVLYTCDIKTILPFEPNDEISQIMFWDIITPVEGHVSEIDLYITQHIRKL